MTLVLSLQRKSHANDPRKKVKNKVGPPKKQLTGFALAKSLRGKDKSSVITGATSIDEEETSSTAVTRRPANKEHCTAPKKRKPKPPSTTRRTRSNALRRSTRDVRPASILDSSHVPCSSYLSRGQAWRSTMQRNSSYSNPEMKKLLKESERYKFLYLNKLNDKVKSQQEELEDSRIVLETKYSPKTSSRDIQELFLRCSTNKAQVVSPDFLHGLGVDGKSRKHVDKTEKIVRGIRTIIDYHFGNFNDAKKAGLVGKWLVEGDIYGEDAGMIVSSSIARQFTRQVFSPWRLLKAIDSKVQGSLNDSAVDDYYHIEADACIDQCKRGHSLLPSRSQISVCRSKMNCLAKQVFKVEHNNDPIKSQHGDHVQVDYESLIRYLINSFGLKEKAMREGVELAFTADGAQICGAKSASQTAAGIKVMDESALDPVTKDLMFVEEFDNNNQPKKLRNYQTFKNHALAEIILHSETKVLVNDVLRDFFIFGMKFGDVGLEARGDEPAFKGKKSHVSTDMSFNHKCVARGGACKNKKFFCYCCECHGDEDMFAFREGTDICKICRHNNRTKCYHRRVNDLEEVEAKTERLLAMITLDLKRIHGDDNNLKDFLSDEEIDCFDGYDENLKVKFTTIRLKDTIDQDGTLHRPTSRDYCHALLHSEETYEVISKSSIGYCPEAILSTQDIRNIDYDLSRDDVQTSIFNGNVICDLYLRGYDETDLFMNYNAGERRNLLKTCLKNSREIKMIRNTLNIEIDARKTQFVEVDRALPCILHANNRTAEKILRMLLVAGWVLCTTKKERDIFVSKVERTINCDIFGKTAFNELGQWRVPREGEALGDVKLSCMDANKLISKMGLIVEVCAEKLTQDKRELWLKCAALYHETMELLKSRYVFSFEDICHFQNTADDFMDVYIHLTGCDGMTNYFHFLHAGHFSFYLLRVKNLYKYSQQGWEHLNGKCKRLYNHNTAKGGGTSGSSKLLPIMYAFLRELLWRFKYGDDLFLRYEKRAMLYGKRVKNIVVDDEAIDLLSTTILNLGSDDDIYGLEDFCDFMQDASNDDIMDFITGEVSM